MTPEDRAQAIHNEYFHGFLCNPPCTFQIEVAAAIRAAVDAERERCAQIASHVFLNDPYALHPDIALDDLNESARMAAHSMAQIISTLIRHGVERAADLPDD